MKTAISMPDETFRRATQEASARGISRSELITRAVQDYLRQLESRSTTARIDDAVALLEHDDSGAAAVTAGRRRLAQEQGDW